MIEVRTQPVEVEHRGTILMAADTRIVWTTPWFTLGGWYRRPTRVRLASGVSIPIRDHVMFMRLAAVVVAVILTKGMRR